MARMVTMTATQSTLFSATTMTPASSSFAMIQAELEATEQAIAAKEAELEQLAQLEANPPPPQPQELLLSGDSDDHDPIVKESPLERLARLEQQSMELHWMQKLTTWVREEWHSIDDEDDIMQQVDALEGFGDLFCYPVDDDDDDNNQNVEAVRIRSLLRSVYEAEFVPLHAYLRSQLLVKLRQTLQAAKYPSRIGCEQLLQEWDDERIPDGRATLEQVQQWCDGLLRLAALQKHVVQALELPGLLLQNNNDLDDVTLELCRPIVERVRFHFVEVDPTRSTTTRIERLPEWLFSYIRENVFESGGAWEIVKDVIAPFCAAGGGGGGQNHMILRNGESSRRMVLLYNFVNEIIRLMQWVLTERNFFRHPNIAGPESKPILMCNAIQQLLQMDHYLQQIVIAASSSGENDQKNRPGPTSSGTNRRQIVSLMDVFVAGDEELLEWWLERERESAFATLFDLEPTKATSNNQHPSLGIAPRAELFCALMRSIRTKAAVFTYNHPYLQHVAAPLCMQFLEAVQESADDLRDAWSTRGRKHLPCNDEFQATVIRWVEVINGTHMAAQMVAPPAGTNTTEAELDGAGNQFSAAERDLFRFGRSLLALQNVLVEDFGKAFVEVLLMERAKLASYLMRCSFLVAHDDEETEMTRADISVELHDTLRYLLLLQRYTAEFDHAEAGDDIQFAPRRMRDCILSLLADKFLDIALDTDGMTPDLVASGCARFERDIQALFVGTFPATLPPMIMRLLDIARLMQMEKDHVIGIGNALCGLAGQPAPLTYDMFEHDDRLADEAMAMVHTKGLVWIQLADVLAVLNRRRDLLRGGNNNDTS